MAVLPTVRMLFPCDDARIDLADEKWTLHHPWGTSVVLPPGMTFPFAVPDIWVYAQLTGGVGTIDLYVELRHLPEGRLPRSIGYSNVTRLELPGGNPWVTFDTALTIRRAPFREPGDYEFRAVAEADDGFRLLTGLSCIIRVLDLRATL